MLHKTQAAAIIILLLIATQSCNMDNRNHHAEYSESVSSDTVAIAAPSEAAALASNEVPSLASNERTIIKKADIRCRVNDVFTATSSLEKLVTGFDGIVSDSRMENQVSEIKRLPYKIDSLKQIRSVTTTSRMTLRVPVAQLDTLLSAIAVQAMFIDTRSLQLSDVTLQYLSNELRSRASTENNTAQKASTLSRKTNDAMIAGQYADERDKQQIERKIENLSLREQATFATLTVDLYQPERMDQLIIADMDKLLKPTFGQQLKGALGNGFAALQVLCIALVNVWPLWLVATLVLYLVRARRLRLIKVIRPD